MSRFIDTHIPINPLQPDDMTPAHVYLAFVAYPHGHQDEDRKRFVGSLRAAVFKAAGKQIPAHEYRPKRENVVKTVRRALDIIATRRVPAVRMALHRWLRMGEIGVVCTTKDAEKWLDAMLRASPAEGLLDPDCWRLESGTALLPERDGVAQLDNIERRIWDDSRPALPMTMALFAALQGDAGKWRRLDALLFDPTWVDDAMATASGNVLALIERTFNPPRSS
jgi:hypothetical protein